MAPKAVRSEVIALTAYSRVANRFIHLIEIETPPCELKQEYILLKNSFSQFEKKVEELIEKLKMNKQEMTF